MSRVDKKDRAAQASVKQKSFFYFLERIKYFGNFNVFYEMYTHFLWYVFFKSYQLSKLEKIHIEWYNLIII